MAIIKKIDDKNIKLAENSIIDHSQLSGRDAYGAHPISAIRKLPEKLSALKKKDEEHDNAISEINEDIVEINEEIVNLQNKDAELTNNIAEVKRHARQISINYDKENKEVTFTNYDGGTNSFIVPKVDEDTLTYRDTDHITLKKVYTDEETISGLGTSESPLEITNKPDELTIITDTNNAQIYAGAIRDDVGVITPQDIRDANADTESEIERLDNKIDATKEQLEEVNSNQQDQINDLLTRTQGMGGYLNAYDFGTATPTQEELTQYAIQDIGSITSQTEIYNGTKVKNLYDNHIWVFNDDPDLQNPWTDQGTDAIIADANNDGLHGLVTGSEEYLEGFIDIKGHITINGLEDKLNSIDSTNEDLQNQITQEVQDRTTADEQLSNDISDETERATQAETTLQENIDELREYSDNTFETKQDAQVSYTELEDAISETRSIAVKYLGTYIVGKSYNLHDMVSYGEYYYISLKDANTDAPAIGTDNESWKCISINSFSSKTIMVTPDNTKIYLLGDKATENNYQAVYRPSNVYVENNIIYDDRGKVASDTELKNLQQLTQDIIDGTQTVKKAEQDGNGEVISSTYMRKDEGLTLEAIEELLPTTKVIET